MVIACTAFERVQTKSSSVFTGLTKTELTAISVGAPGVGLHTKEMLHTAAAQHDFRLLDCTGSEGMCTAQVVLDAMQQY